LACSIEYKSSVRHDLKKLERKAVLRILDAIDEQLGTNPDAGSPLSGRFKGLFKFRVGNYRVIYSKTKNGVLILRIDIRGRVYKKDIVQ